ncbi:MAG: hypothetical protein IT340_10220 [Chloroflexi bacterium]|nr:hypothetical protein [Chloroflexota bacterium]
MRLPGFGNCVWNCTFRGFGDTFKFGHDDNGAGTWGAPRACYVYRNWVPMGGDDGIEFDEAGGNCAAYDNRIANTASGASFDGISSGPVGLFRNVFVNQARQTLKFTSAARGVRIWNNTWVQTNKMGPTPINWNDAALNDASGSIYDFDFRNNLLTYRGSGALISFNQTLLGSTLTDYNAWYPDGRNIYFGSGTGTWTGLTSAKANLAPRMAHDVIVASDPFASPITLGADYTTEYTGHLDARITSGAARNAGVPIAGVTDGFTGAAPDIGADITGRTTPAIGATSNPYMPEWARTQTAQTWAEVPMAATLDDINPAANSAINPNYPSSPEWGGTTGQWSIVGAWCGATYDEDGDVMWLGLGGGHSNYGGNEVYRCRFSAAAPVWEMVRWPSGAVGNLLTTHDGQESSGIYSDGRPRAVHTYNKWVYVPGVGPALAVHGNTSYSATAGREWSVFIDPVTGEASFSVEHGGGAMNDHTSGLGACYDPTRRAIWIAPSGLSSIYRYDIPTSGSPAAGSAASLIGNTGSVRYYTSVTYLPGHDCLLVGNSVDEYGDSGTWRVFDCATGTGYNPSFSGQAPGVGKTQPRWVPALGAVCHWNHASSTTQITRLTPGANPRTDAWTVSTLPVSGANAVTPSARVSQGTYGRFAYSPRMGGFLVFNSTSGPHYFYKI